MQPIPRLVVNLSKNTSEFTSKTNQIRLGGAHGALGLGEYTWERLVRSPTRGYLSDGRAYETNETAMRLL